LKNIIKSEKFVGYEMEHGKIDKIDQFFDKNFRERKVELLGEKIEEFMKFSETIKKHLNRFDDL